MRLAKNIAIVIVLLLTIIVVLQNTETVQTKVLVATFEMPRALLLILTLLVGVAAGFIAGIKLGRPAKVDTSS